MRIHPKIVFSLISIYTLTALFFGLIGTLSAFDSLESIRRYGLDIGLSVLLMAAYLFYRAVLRDLLALSKEPEPVTEPAAKDQTPA